MRFVFPRIELLHRLFDKKNEYLWDWIICYLWIDDKESVLNKVRKLYKNVDYRISPKEETEPPGAD